MTSCYHSSKISGFSTIFLEKDGICIVNSFVEIPKFCYHGNMTKRLLLSIQDSTHIQPINPLSPNIHKQILQTDLYTFPYRISWEKLIKDQRFFSL